VEVRRASAVVRQKELTMRAGIDGRAVFFGLVSGLAVIACTGGTPATGSPLPTTASSATTSPSASPTVAVRTLTPSAATSPTPSASATAATSSNSPTPLGGGPSGSGVPVAIDPCSLLTNDQATAVNGVTYGDGVAHDMDNGGRECVWQSKSPAASVVVQIGQFPSVSEAQIAFGQAQAELAGAQVETLTGFADDAAIGRGAAAGLATGGIYVREGSTLFDVIYHQGTVPPDDQLKYFATLILGELPAPPAGP
jgi:hypothetical protein